MLRSERHGVCTRRRTSHSGSILSQFDPYAARRTGRVGNGSPVPPGRRDDRGELVLSFAPRPRTVQSLCRPSTFGVWDIADPMNEFAARARDTESTACRQVVDSSGMPEESSFRSLAETSLQGIIVHRDWRILFANRAAAQTLGYPTVEELVSGTACSPGRVWVGLAQ